MSEWMSLFEGTCFYIKVFPEFRGLTNLHEMRNLPAERNSELGTPSLKSISDHRLVGAMVALQSPHNLSCEGTLVWP